MASAQGFAYRLCWLKLSWLKAQEKPRVPLAALGLPGITCLETHRNIFLSPDTGNVIIPIDSYVSEGLKLQLHQPVAIFGRNPSDQSTPRWTTAWKRSCSAPRTPCGSSSCSPMRRGETDRGEGEVGVAPGIWFEHD